MTRLIEGVAAMVEWVGRALSRSIVPDGSGRIIDVAPPPPPDPRQRQKRPPWRP
jgi:hypothetical protein